MLTNIRLWLYNNLLRHWHNWRYQRGWIKRGRPGTYCPRAGRITKTAVEWANEGNANHKTQNAITTIRAVRKRFADALEDLAK
jgi:hypothetical protein